MAPKIESYYGWWGAAVTPVTTRKLYNVRAGELLLIFVGNNANTNTAQFSGFTDADGHAWTMLFTAGGTTAGAHGAVFYRWATGAEFTNPVVIPSTSAASWWTMPMSISAVGPAGILKQGSEGQAGPSTTHSITGTATVSKGDSLLLMMMPFSRGFTSAPTITGSTWELIEEINWWSSGSDATGALAKRVLPTAGPVGAYTVTLPEPSGTVVRAWLALDPGMEISPPDELEVGQQYTISGKRLGNSAGKLYIADVVQQIDAWSDTSITFTVVEETPVYGFGMWATGATQGITEFHNPSVMKTPVIDAVIPNHGTHGDVITVTGRNLLYVDRVILDDGEYEEYQSYTPISDTEFTFTVNGYRLLGPVTLRVEATWTSQYAATAPFTVDNGIAGGLQLDPASFSAEVTLSNCFSGGLTLADATVAGEIIANTSLAGGITLADAVMSGDLAAAVDLSGGIALADAIISGTLASTASANELTGALSLDDALFGGVASVSIDIGGGLLLDDAVISGVITDGIPANAITGALQLADALFNGAIGVEAYLHGGMFSDAFFGGTTTLQVELSGGIHPHTIISGVIGDLAPAVGMVHVMIGATRTPMPHADARVPSIHTINTKRPSIKVRE